MKFVALTAAIVAALSSYTAMAAPAFDDTGRKLTDNGGWTSPYGTRNPAASEFAIAGDSTVRMGIFSSFGFGLEMGPVDNFADGVEELMDQLDREDITLSEGNALVNRFNAMLPVIGRDGYLKLNSGLQVPLFPFLVRSDFGVLALDANITGQGRLGVLDAPLTYNSVSEELETPTAAYIKTATLTEVALGFSRPVWEHESGRVIVGASARYVRAALNKQVIALESVEDDEEVEDILKDAYDANEHTSNGVTADLGAIYSGERFRVGLTLANLTEPSFDYGRIGANCGSLSGDAQYNCYSAAFFSNRIALEETWTLERLATVEGALLFARGAGHLSASADLNEVHDPVGDLNQDVSVALGYKTQTSWLPDVRLGYRKNLVGTELSSASAGLTFFGCLHLDVAYGFESAEIDGRAVPRTLGFNLGLEMSY